MSDSGEGKYPSEKWNEGHCEHMKVKQDTKTGEKEKRRKAWMFFFLSLPFDPRNPSMLPHREPVQHLTRESKDDPKGDVSSKCKARHKTWEGMMPFVPRILLMSGNWRLHCFTKPCPRDRCSICFSSFPLPIVLLCEICQQQRGGDKPQVCFSSRQIIVGD